MPVVRYLVGDRGPAIVSEHAGVGSCSHKTESGSPARRHRDKTDRRGSLRRAREAASRFRLVDADVEGEAGIVLQLLLNGESAVHSVESAIEGG